MIADTHARRVPAALLAFLALLALAAACLVPARATPATPESPDPPDAQALCRDRGYPVGTAATWFYDECVRVGSFTHQAEIPGLFRGSANAMEPAAQPMPLARAPAELDYRWQIDQTRGLGVDDYLRRQRVMALLIVRNGVIEVERYQYARSAAHRFVSQSMAKTVTALAVGYAAQEGLLRLDDRADAHAPALAGTLYGEATVRQLLRMASGAAFEERYDGRDDLARYGAAALRGGAAAGARVITTRAHPAGEVFNYASAETDMLALVLRGATGRTLSQYLQPRLWQPMGAESSALWRAGADGLERAGGNLNATARDWARLGVLLAHDGRRPDQPDAGAVLPVEFLLEATDWRRHPPAFAPRRATPYYGYGYQVWTFPGERRRFALLGVYGQAIFVDPEQKLVMVHLAANATARAGQTSMGREMGALWHAVVTHRGRW
ncbi:MAG: serine hydrolase domain-containing protein [Rubrivivax sp.]